MKCLCWIPNSVDVSPPEEVLPAPSPEREPDFVSSEEVRSIFYIYLMTDEFSGDGERREKWKEATFSLKKSGDLRVVPTEKKDEKEEIINLRMSDYMYEECRVGEKAKNIVGYIQCDLPTKDRNALILIPNKDPDKVKVVSNSLWVHFPTKKGFQDFVNLCNDIFRQMHFPHGPSHQEARRIRDDVRDGIEGESSDGSRRYLNLKSF